MACGGCNSKRKYTNKVNDVSKEDLFGKYKYLSNKQIEARLDSYKRKNCTDCDKRYECNYTSFLACKQGE